MDEQPQATPLQSSIAKWIMPQVEALAKEKKIRKHAAFYVFLGMVPSDLTDFSEYEVYIMKQAAARPEIGKRTETPPAEEG